MNEKRLKYGHFLFAFFFSLVLIALDWTSKRLITNEMSLYEKKDIISGFFSLHYVRNTGSAFSFLADKSWGITVLTGISAILGVIIFYALIKASKLHDSLSCIAFCLLLSGAIGNFLDRVLYRSVVDFLRFDFGPYTFPIFNIADICAVIGTFLFVGIILFGGERVDKLLEVISHDIKIGG